jgi:hypothetical protein
MLRLLGPNDTVVLYSISEVVRHQIRFVAQPGGSDNSYLDEGFASRCGEERICTSKLTFDGGVNLFGFVSISTKHLSCITKARDFQEGTAAERFKIEPNELALGLFNSPVLDEQAQRRDTALRRSQSSLQ